MEGGAPEQVEAPGEALFAQTDPLKDFTSASHSLNSLQVAPPAGLEVEVQNPARTSADDTTAAANLRSATRAA